MERSRASAREAARVPASARLLRTTRQWRSGLPTEVGTLGALILVAAVCCLLGTLFPLSDKAPVGIGRVLTPIGFGLGAAMLLAGPRAPRWTLHAGVQLVAFCTCLLISRSATNGGVMMTAWTLIWLTVYVAIFFGRRAIRLHTAAITIGLGAALLIAGIPNTQTQFVMIVLTLWAAATALGNVSERLRSQAEGDHLTGILNRNGFMKMARRELALAGRTGYQATIALIDLDGFKAVNDAEGHAAGDRLLRELAQAWEGVLRPGDVLARYGGDEFVVLFPATSEQDAKIALARMHAAHEARWSVGVAAWERGEPLDVTLARADMRLYEAKGRRG